MRIVIGVAMLMGSSFLAGLGLGYRHAMQEISAFMDELDTRKR